MDVVQSTQATATIKKNSEYEMISLRIRNLLKLIKKNLHKKRLIIDKVSCRIIDSQPGRLTDIMISLYTLLNLTTIVLTPL
jgi:hypothetical protein